MKVEYQGQEFKVKRKAKYIAADDAGEVYTFKKCPTKCDDRYRNTEEDWAYVGQLNKAAGVFEEFPLMEIKITASLEEVKP